MSKFSVGQRVRIIGEVWLGGGATPAGSIGTVVSMGHIGITSGRMYDYGVVSDEGIEVAADEYELEPLDEINEKAEWKECVWKPEHMREVA